MAEADIREALLLERWRLRAFLKNIFSQNGYVQDAGERGDPMFT
jgi:hypothetical protein